MNLTQSAVVLSMLAEFPGAAVNVPDPADLGTVVASNDAVEQVGTIVVATATNSHDYTVLISDREVTYSADGSTSKIEIADGLADAINDDPIAYGVVEASSDGIDTVTVTAREGGEDAGFTMSTADAKLTVTEASTAGADATEIPPGRALWISDFNTDGSAIGKLPLSTALTARVLTVTADYAASETYTVMIRMSDGRVFGAVSVPATTNDADTATAIAAAINAAAPANTVIAVATSGGALTLTAEIAGLGFEAEVATLTGTAARLTVAVTTAGTDLAKKFAGVALYAGDIEGANYAGAGAVRVMKRGQVWILHTSATVANGDQVYVETSGSNAGKLFNAGSSTRVPLPKDLAVWVRHGTRCAVLELKRAA